MTAKQNYEGLVDIVLKKIELEVVKALGERTDIEQVTAELKR